MRQQWRQDNNTQKEPVYDSQTVRQVLARASEIQQTEPDVLSVSQVEALGRELGISPEAVRRALGEIETRPIAPPIVTAPINTDTRLRPLPFRDIITSPIPGLVTGLLYLLICYTLSATHFNPGNLIVGASLFFLFGTPLALSIFLGWQRNKYRSALLNSLFITLFTIIGAFTGIALAETGSVPSEAWGAMLLILFFSLILNSLAAAGGVWLRRRYESEKADRHRLEHR